MNKRNLFFLFTLLTFSLSAFAQTTNNKGKDNLLFMVRQQEHISQAIKTVEHLQENKTTTVKMNDAVIIVCGEAVKFLASKDSEQLLAKSKNFKNLTIYACGLSLDKFNLTEKDMPHGVKYTTNGFIKAFELQKQGYLSIEL
jgi:intracellular sulfur oxidation DsrE/DsrF family protein